MIEELRIQGIGVIAEARIEFGPGLTVITGETGAGKTMVLTGLDLLRGSRADTGALRSGDSGAEVDAVVAVDEARDTRLIRTLESLDFPVEDGAVVTRRTLSPSGRSRAYLAGRPVPVGILSEVWAQVVSVHGQMDQTRLRESSWQRSIVDRFGAEAIAPVMSEYTQVWQQWQGVLTELRQALAETQDLERAAALLRLGIAEIDDVAPELGEDTALDAEAEVLAHAGALRDAGELARSALVGSGDDIDPSAAVSRLAGACDALTGVATFDERLADVAARLRSLLTEASDIQAELGNYLRGLDADPARQAWVEDRRAKLAALRKSYGATMEEVLQWRADAVSRVEAADSHDDRIDDLRDQERTLAKRLVTVAERLTAARGIAAEELTAVVQGELAALAMPQAVIEVQMESTNDPESLRSHGGDDITILLAAHPGAPLRPLGKGASGGELSRLALAFEVALAGRDSTPTMVFDEVDAGVGGAVAVEVGKRLARLARHVQVVVVTHLPQVAAFADRHLVVTKDHDGQVTSADVCHVDDDDRLAELVRMLSGLEGSATGAAHARELLEMARQEVRSTDGSGSPSQRSLSSARAR